MIPFEVRFERVDMFCEVLTVTALVTPLYVRPVENVVVAELNFEKSEAAIHPDVPEFAVAHVSTDAREPITDIGCERDSAPDAVSEVVATFANVLADVK
jgi:2-phospho-L-lactate transferase/gluconeogenesis factor (CofD/UPF0052 family)